MIPFSYLSGNKYRNKHLSQLKELQTLHLSLNSMDRTSAMSVNDMQPLLKRAHKGKLTSVRVSVNCLDERRSGCRANMVLNNRPWKQS
jgi:hypothetical protein